MKIQATFFSESKKGRCYTFKKIFESESVIPILEDVIQVFKNGSGGQMPPYHKMTLLMESIDK